jgi:hypothetical protein
VIYGHQMNVTIVSAWRTLSLSRKSMSPRTWQTG